MTVKEMHYLNAGVVERYINRKTGERLTLDYDDAYTDEFREAFSIFQKICRCPVSIIWALVDHDGRAVLVIEYDNPA